MHRPYAVHVQEMLTPRVEHGLAKHLNPRGFFPVPVRGVACLDGAVLRLVAQEVGRVHIEAFDDPGGTELDHGLVVAFGALAAAFPAVHPLAAFSEFLRDEDGLLRFDQVLLLGEEIIGTPQHLGPKALGSEVDEVGEGGGLLVFHAFFDHILIPISYACLEQ